MGPPAPSTASPTWSLSAGPRVSCSREAGGGGRQQGGGGAGARAPAGWLAGREREGERAAGSERGRPRPDREPGSELSLAQANRPGLQPLGAGPARWAARFGKQARTLLVPSSLLAFSPPSIFLSPLPSFSQVYLTGAGGFFLRDALAAAPDALGGSGGSRLARGQARSQGSHLAAVAAAAVTAAPAAGEAAPSGQQQNWSVI